MRHKIHSGFALEAHNGPQCMDEQAGDKACNSMADKVAEVCKMKFCRE